MPLNQTFLKATDSTCVYEACRVVVEKYFGNRNGSTRVRLDLLARSKGIKVDYRSNLPFEGMIERESDGSASILIRTGLNKRRERFTLAHELGHWMLQQEMLGTMTGQLFRGLSRDEQELKEEESLANLLAAELLLPAQAMPLAFSPQSPVESLVDVCRRFEVSRTTAVRRIADTCGLNIVFLQIMPYLFTDDRSLAQIDDAVYASSRKGTLFDRTRTRFVHKTHFCDVVATDRVEMTLKTPKGMLNEVFFTQRRDDPVPHAFAIATLTEWPTAQGSV